MPRGQRYRRFAFASDVTHIADRVPEHEREILIETLTELEQFAALLREALSGALPAENKGYADRSMMKTVADSPIKAIVDDSKGDRQ
jgi:hypothetical protein